MKQEIKERVEKIRKGEVPEGYKETKVGIIPEDWDFKKISDLFNISAGGDLDLDFFSEKQDEEHKYPIYSNSLQKNGLYGWYKIRQYSGDKITVTARGSIGHSEYHNQDFSAFGRILILESKHKFNLYTISEQINFSVRIFNESTGVPQLTVPQFRTYYMNIPGFKEQEKIAEILSTWDKAIELKEKHIEEKREFKKGFMQKLLFKGVTSNILWSETQLRKCLVPTSYPVNKPSEPYYALGIRSHCKGTFVRHVEDPKKIAMDTLYEVKENELILNITFAWEGAITLLNKKDEGKLVSHRFPTYKFNEEYTIPDYFKHLIKTKWFVFQLGSLSPGGAGRNRVFNKKDFLKLKILLPSVEEQRKIADFLNSIDNNIELLNKELNQLKEQKIGLMQLLLTGIVRVEVN